MEKELTPLETWYLIKKHLNKIHHQIVRETIEVKTIESHPIDVIEKALEDYESRKTLLENIDKDIIVFEPKEVWEEKQKKLKALEIIKKYNLRPSSIIISTDYEDFMEYNFLAEGETIKEFFDRNEYLAPTKEEYGLLKEVLI